MKKKKGRGFRAGRICKSAQHFRQLELCVNLRSSACGLRALKLKLNYAKFSHVGAQKPKSRKKKNSTETGVRLGMGEWGLPTRPHLMWVQLILLELLASNCNRLAIKQQESDSRHQAAGIGQQLFAGIAIKNHLANCLAAAAAAAARAHGQSTRAAARARCHHLATPDKQPCPNPQAPTPSPISIETLSISRLRAAASVFFLPNRAYFSDYRNGT